MAKTKKKVKAPASNVDPYAKKTDAAASPKLNYLHMKKADVVEAERARKEKEVKAKEYRESLG